MKYTAILAAAFMLATIIPAVNAQNLVTASLEYGESVTPLTAIKVAVTVEKERVVPGPYARYAQKYLGAMPPLSERTGCSIVRASLSAEEYKGEEEGCKNGDGIKVRPNVYNPHDFVRFPIDRMSAAEMTAENMARDAANTIFALRKRRFDLISGEAGEYVFGEGLRAALEELARMEEEYVSLFMGKTTVETTTEIYEVVPMQGQANYIVCRFSPEEGLLPESDLSAAPIVLTVSPSGAPAGVGVPRGDKKTGTLVRIAAWTDCTLMDGSQTLAAKRLPVFQLGETVNGR